VRVHLYVYNSLQVAKSECSHLEAFQVRVGVTIVDYNQAFEFTGSLVALKTSCV